ncbi:MAG: transcription initiation factor IIB family protein [Pyrobaculum sp.]
MICTYCKSDKIVLVEGEYVCTECGTVVGYELMPPVVKHIISIRRENRIFIKLEKEKREIIKKKYSEIVKFYIEKICSVVGGESVRTKACDLFKNLDKRVYQGKNPRVLAASLVYLAAESLGMHIPKQSIAKVLSISKFTIRDTVSRLRKHVSTS